VTKKNASIFGNHSERLKKVNHSPTNMGTNCKREACSIPLIGDSLATKAKVRLFELYI